MNSVTVAMIRELVAAVDEADADDAVRCVVVTGAGRQFCAGADLAKREEAFAFEHWGEEGATLAEGRDGGGSVTLRIFDSPKPFVAAINGSPWASA